MTLHLLGTPRGRHPPAICYAAVSLHWLLQLETRMNTMQPPVLLGGCRRSISSSPREWPNQHERPLLIEGFYGSRHCRCMTQGMSHNRCSDQASIANRSGGSAPGLTWEIAHVNSCSDLQLTTAIYEDLRVQLLQPAETPRMSGHFPFKDRETLRIRKLRRLCLAYFPFCLLLNCCSYTRLFLCTT